MDSHEGIEFHLWFQGSLESWCEWDGLWGHLEDMPTGTWASDGPWPGASGCSQLLTAAHWFQLSMSSAWLGPGAGQRGCSAGHPWSPLLGGVWRAA